jgi:hypothetical protein
MELNLNQERQQAHALLDLLPLLPSRDSPNLVSEALPCLAFGAIRRFGLVPPVKLKPRTSAPAVSPPRFSRCLP